MIDFRIVKSKDGLKEIHSLFFDVLNEMNKYYVKETIIEEKESYSLNKFVNKYSERNNYAYGIYSNEELIGFIIFYIEGGIAFLEWMGIKKGFRGKGYAKSLNKHVEKFLKKNTKVHKIFCDCLTVNKESIQTLKKSGFKKILRINNHWNKQDYYFWERIIS